MEVDKKSKEELLQQLADGSEHAFTQLFNLYQARIFATAFEILKSREHAQEIVQDIFLKIWTTRESFLKVENLDAWIFTMARNKTLNLLKKLLNDRKIQFHYAAAHGRVDNNVEHSMQDKEYTRIFNQTLELLPAQQKQVYYLAKVEGLPFTDIAQKMNISPLTVGVHMKRALKFLRGKIIPIAKLNSFLLFLLSIFH
jgi:RNA polymerase sigma-70 factor (ECF subfamily)